MKNGFAPQPAVNGFAEQRLRAFVDDVVAPGEQQRQAADRAALIEWAGSTWPAVAAKAALSGAMLPGDVAQGKFSMDDPRAIERLTDLTGLITLGAGALPAPRNSLRAGIKAYHGSPHDFDEFSLSKIGTGEGNQGEGYGLYFAQQPRVAKSYRNALSARHGTGAGRLYEVEIDANPSDFLKIDEPWQGQEDVGRRLGIVSAEEKERLIQTAQAKVLADATEADFNDLDWLFGELSEDQAKAVNALDEARKLRTFDEVTPGELLGQTIDQEKAFTEYARSRGVPGTSYWDAASRPGKAGTRNYVVFDDKLINILRKYGIAVPAGMAGYEMTQDQFRQYVGEQQAQQYERENGLTRMGIL